MRAAVVAAPGVEWKLSDVPTPQPGPGEVLIRVRASGVCHNDVWTTNGVFPFPAGDPVITGHEAAGEIVALGAGVTSRVPGDRVGATWIRGGCGRCAHCRCNLPITGTTGMRCPEASMTGLNTQGAHAEYLVAPASSTVLLPDTVSFEAAAPVLCAGYTAWSALRASEPAPHERVAVLGVGGLGHMAVQFAHACGFETVAITRSPDKHGPVRKLGADIVVANSEELLNAGGADVILVTGTSYAAASDALRGLRTGGRLVLATIDPVNSFTIDPSQPFWAQRQKVIGATHGGLHLLTEALDLVAKGAVSPMVQQFPAEQVAEAVKAVDEGRVRFRAVVTW